MYLAWIIKTTTMYETLGHILNIFGWKMHAKCGKLRIIFLLFNIIFLFGNILGDYTFNSLTLSFLTL